MVKPPYVPEAGQMIRVTQAEFNLLARIRTLAGWYRLELYVHECQPLDATIEEVKRERFGKADTE